MSDSFAEQLDFTVLADNLAEDGLLSEWGLSILFHVAASPERSSASHACRTGTRILLDGGMSDAFCKNAAVLGMDLSEIDIAVLSHAHYDHADGLEAFFSANTRANVYLQACCANNCFRRKSDGSYKYIGIRAGMLEQHADRFIRVSAEKLEIAPAVYLIPHKKRDYRKIAIRGHLYHQVNGEMLPEDFAHEQSLVFRRREGLVICNSCSHTGPAGIVEEVREAMGEERIFAYIGGLHLFDLPDEEILQTAQELASADIAHIYTGHCTGDHAFAILKEQLGERIEQFYAGFQPVFG